MNDGAYIVINNNNILRVIYLVNDEGIEKTGKTLAISYRHAIKAELLIEYGDIYTLKDKINDCISETTPYSEYRTINKDGFLFLIGDAVYYEFKDNKWYMNEKLIQI